MKDLVKGSARFEKVQIKEVTSHFRNGWIFFVVYPKVTKEVGIPSGYPKLIPGFKIKPLVLEKIVVKAKKTKEKDNLEDTGTVQEDENNAEAADEESKDSETQK